MLTKDLDYTLPPELIATAPAPTREAARLLVVKRSNPADISHHHIRDLPTFINPHDAITLNNTAVLRARINATREDTNGSVTGLFLSSDPNNPTLWTLLLKSNGKLREGQRLRLSKSSTATLTLKEKHQSGQWTATLDSPLSPQQTLANLGAVPLPPYIIKARKDRQEQHNPDNDATRYQTTYANPAHTNSVAAPTAGLHLTPQLLSQIETAGATINTLTLDVGAGTFKPIDTETLDAHPMHTERISVPAQTLAAIDTARAASARSIAIGTTTARALESVPPNHSTNHNTNHTTDYTADTNILIAPPYTWKRTDALLTNFHLPRSTLIAMVAALFPQGINDLLPIYQNAITQRYRFYSFGDAMLILP